MGVASAALKYFKFQLRRPGLEVDRNGQRGDPFARDVHRALCVHFPGCNAGEGAGIGRVKSE